jgi:hypothetical protein
MTHITVRASAVSPRLALDGEIQVVTAAGERTSGEVGLLVEFFPGERHEVVASADTRLLLLLTPVARQRPARCDDDPSEALHAATRGHRIRRRTPDPPRPRRACNRLNAWSGERR